MPINVFHGKASQSDVDEMLPVQGDFRKLAVDVALGVVAAGGNMHADCEEILLQSGSNQDDIWGADWVPAKRLVEFESLINIRPRLGNRSILIQDPAVRSKIDAAVRKVFDF